MDTAYGRYADNDGDDSSSSTPNTIMSQNLPPAASPIKRQVTSPHSQLLHRKPRRSVSQ